MIVIEGPDGAGKTTLINKIVEATGLEIAPRVVTKDAEAMVDLQQWVQHNLAFGQQKLIFDRHRLISEPIYGPILRRKLEPGFSDLAWLVPAIQKFYAVDPLIIYCLPPLYRVWENIQDDPDNKVVAQQEVITKIWGAYLNKASTDFALRGNTWIYNYVGDEDGSWSDMVVNRVKDYLQEIR